MSARATWTLRVACVEALAAVRTPVATRALLEALAHDGDVFVRAAAARGLRGRRSEAGVEDALARAAEDADEAVRAAATGDAVR